MSDPTQVPGEVISTGAKAGETLIGEGPLGAIVVLLFIAVGLLVWLVYKAKNAHIKDKDTMIQLMNAQSVEVQGSLKDVKNALENLQKENGGIITSLTAIRDSVTGLTQQVQIWQIQSGQQSTPRG